MTYNLIEFNVLETRSLKRNSFNVGRKSRSDGGKFRGERALIVLVDAELTVYIWNKSLRILRVYHLLLNFLFNNVY